MLPQGQVNKTDRREIGVKALPHHLQFTLNKREIIKSEILLLRSGTSHTSSQLNESGLSCAVQSFIVLLFSGDLSGSGDQCAALYSSSFSLLCFLNSTLTCFTISFSCLLLPSSSFPPPSSSECADVLYHIL